MCGISRSGHYILIIIDLFSNTQAHIHIPQKQRLEMWANAQRDGRSAEHRWRRLFNAAVWLTPTTTCRAVTLP